MRITVIADNRPETRNTALETEKVALGRGNTATDPDKVVTDSERGALGTEHGLCFWIEGEGRMGLLDVGASDLFLRNAARLGVDVAEVDFLVLSHAHNDHTGGLACFLEANRRAKVYLSANIRGARYFSNRRKDMRDISIDYSLIQRFPERFVFVSDNLQLTPTVRIIAKIPVRHPLPLADRTLFADAAPDTFNHEMALLLTGRTGSALISSCTHLGLLNTLESCRPVTPDLFIGGLHLIDSDPHPEVNNPTDSKTTPADSETNPADSKIAHATSPACCFETARDYESLAATILESYPALHIYTGHCTGTQAAAHLTRLLPDRFHLFHTASTWEI